MTERWLPVAGHEGRYEVSDLGRVRSFVNSRGNLKSVPTYLSLRPRKAGNTGHGYVIVFLGQDDRRYVHELVLTTFVGPRPPGMESCHGDDVRHNNRLGNLCWGTHKKNLADMTSRGRRKALLTDDDVRCIRAEPNFYGVCAMLARCFGVKSAVIEKARRGTSFKRLLPLEMERA